MEDSDKFKLSKNKIEAGSGMMNLFHIFSIVILSYCLYKNNG